MCDARTEVQRAHRKDDFPKAVEEYTEAIKRDPDSPAAVFYYRLVAVWLLACAAVLVRVRV